MIRRVWFAPEVYGELSNREATFSVCLNSVTQYMIEEAQKHGNVNVDIEKFDDNICAITREAIASLDPHLRYIVGVVVRRDAPLSNADIEVRLSPSYQSLCANNPGINSLH